jgi:hypothetical protein
MRVGAVIWGSFGMLVHPSMEPLREWIDGPFLKTKKGFVNKPFYLHGEIKFTNIAGWSVLDYQRQYEKTKGAKRASWFQWSELFRCDRRFQEQCEG